MPTTFEQDVRTNPQDGRPVNISMRARFVGGGHRANPHDILQRAATTLQSFVYHAVKRYKPRWSKQYILANVTGLLQIHNTFSEGKGYAGHNNVKVSDITTDELDELLEELNTEYQLDLDVYAVVWDFYIDPNVFILGGGDGVKRKLSELEKTSSPGLDNHSLIEYEHEGRPVACAAVAIVLHLMQYRPDLYSDRGKHAYTYKTRRIAANAFDLQTKLGWGKLVSIAELGRFVEHADFSAFRLVVIEPTLAVAAAMASGFDFRGAQYVYDEVLGKHPTIIYIRFDAMAKHYSRVTSPKELVRSEKRSDTYTWCHRCASMFIRGRGHQCETDAGNLPKPRPEREKCSKCNITYSKSNRTKHRCGKILCLTCNAYKKAGVPDFAHRCPLFKDHTKPKPDFLKPSETATRKNQYSVWVYDIESQLVPIPEGRKSVTSFAVDEEGFFVDSQGAMQTLIVKAQQHVPNLVCFRNLFDTDGETRVLESLEEFLHEMLQYNGGRNICLAHNASGYDSRLIFNAAVNMLGTKRTIKPILRGGKIMRFEIDNLIFMDTMLHIKGSLKDLAKSFFPKDIESRKGYFPHLFNLPENQRYVGDIPDKRYFDMTFTCKTQKDLDEFNTWYAEEHLRTAGKWSFRDEIVRYCKQDVDVLAKIALEYHTMCGLLASFDDCLTASPWHFPTSAGYVHDMFLRYNSKMLEIDVEDPESIQKAAYNGWCVLEPEEHYFDRLALRGGRTEIRKFYHTITERAWESGDRISYVDVVSMYPFVQVAKQYPVGPPLIQVFHEDFYPCSDHYEHPLTPCGCSLEDRRAKVNRKLLIEEKFGHAFEEYSDTITIICCDVQPPDDLYHPILIHYDSKRKKCLGSLEPIHKGIFTGEELKVALQHGYTIGRVYRAHQYKKADSLWFDLMRELFRYKLENSGAVTDPVEAERIKNAYKTRFDMDVEPLQFQKRPAVKQTFKILFNSAWGKHAETTDHVQSMVHNHEDSEAISDFIHTLSEDTRSMKSFLPLDQYTLFKYVENRKKIRPNLHKGYVTAALFVPAYGRLLLLEQLLKLDTRVLMHDTDSIIYLKKPDQYDPPAGDIWGEWQTEDFELEHGGIRSFIGTKPKEYGLEAADGTKTFKCKGVAIKHAHSKLINFDVAKQLVLGQRGSVSVPQYTFVANIGQDIWTRYFSKTFSFQRHVLKGVYDEGTYQLWPYGHYVIKAKHEEA